MDGLVLAAAGSSTRFGGKTSKVLRSLAGTPVIVRALAPFLVAVESMALVVVARKSDWPVLKRLLPRARLAEGGATRAASVKAGLDALPAAVETVLVHDAARPLVSADLVRRVLASARRHGAAAAVVRVYDSLHRVQGATKGQPAYLLEPVDRTTTVAAQTPQAVRADLFREAFETLGADALAETDEVGLLRRAGIPVVVVLGDERNIKLTTPADLVLAESILEDL